MPPAALPRRLVAAAAALSVFAASVSAPAQGRDEGPMQTIIRDAEIEQLLREYSAPIFQAAGIPSGAAQIVLIGDRSFNAFVANGRKIFINTGALIDSKTPNEVVGVIAHESGHIAGGHLARLRLQLANAQILSVAGMLLGAAAMVGAATGGRSVGNGGAGAAGVMLGSQDLAMRNLLSYQRTEEQAADRAAIRFLDATGQSAKGMLDTFRRFADNSLLTSSMVDPYRQSHPLPAERIAALQTLATQSPNYGKVDPPPLQARHDLMRAKLVGFMERPDQVLRRYPPYDLSLPSRYARAISVYRAGRSNEALGQIDGLIREQPANAYFIELKGQVLLESGRPREALPALRRAVSLAPNGGPIRMLLGRALLAADQPALVNEAISVLSNAAQREKETPDVFRDLGLAYGRRGEIGLAEAATAQYYFLLNDLPNAQTQASRAMDKLPPKSAAYMKAEDILNYRPSRPD